MQEISRSDQYFPNHEPIAMSYANPHGAARNLMGTFPFADWFWPPNPTGRPTDFPIEKHPIPTGTIT